MATLEELLAQGYSLPGSDTAMQPTEAAPAPVQAPSEPPLGLMGNMQNYGPLMGLANYTAEQPSIKSLINNPSNIGRSDWWLTRPSGEKISPQQAIEGAASATLQSPTFGFADEGIAGLEAAKDALVNQKPFGQSFSDNLSRIKSSENSFREASPTVSTAMDVAGAFAAPRLLPSAARRGVEKVAGTLGANVAEGALIGGAAGAGTSEGSIDDRLASAKTGAIAGGLTAGAIDLTGKAINKVGELSGRWGSAEQKKALGITVADADRARKKARIPVSQPSPIDKSLERLQGMTNATGDAPLLGITQSKNPTVLHGRLVEKLDDVDQTLERVLTKADAQIGKALPKGIQFDGIQQSVKDDLVTQIKAKFKGVQQEAALRHLDAQLNAITKQASEVQNAGSNTLSFLQSLKQQMWKTGYGGAEDAAGKAAVDRMIGFKLKDVIEKTVDQLVQKGKLHQGLAGSIKRLNKDMGAILDVLPSVARKANLSTGQGVLDQVFGGLLRTTGGIGGLLVGGMAGGNMTPAKVAGGLYALTSMPTARYALGGGMKAAGPIVRDFGSLFSNSAIPATVYTRK